MEKGSVRKPKEVKKDWVQALEEYKQSLIKKAVA